MSTQRFSDFSIYARFALLGPVPGASAGIVVVGIVVTRVHIDIAVGVYANYARPVVSHAQRAVLVDPQLAEGAVPEEQLQCGAGLGGLDLDPVEQLL